MPIDIDKEVNKLLKSTVVMSVLYELVVATRKFDRFNSAHEGYAVLKEEFDALWEEIRKKQSSIDRVDGMREEAIQVAAMSLRFLFDCCEAPSGKT